MEVKNTNIYQVIKGFESQANRLRQEAENTERLIEILKAVNTINKENNVISKEVISSDLKEVMQEEIEFCKSKEKKGDGWKSFVKGRCLKIENELGKRIKPLEYIKYIKENM